MKPVLFEIGPFVMYSYGAMLAVGFLIATTLAIKHANGEGIASGKIFDLALVILISGIIGARALYVILNWSDFLKTPLRIFLLNEGGLVIFGGFALGIPTGIWFIKRNSLPFWKTLDIISTYAALAQAIGRIGCFLNGCCFGKPTDSFLGVYFPGHSLKVHPTQLYSSLALFLIFVILKLLHRRRHFDGQIFFCYLILYSLFRFFIEILRGDNTVFIFGFTFSQCVSILLFTGSVVFYAIRRVKACRTTPSR